MCVEEILSFLIQDDREFWWRISCTYIFADDTALLYSYSNLPRIEGRVNKDLEESVVSWIESNKIGLNVDKTEVILFKLT